MPLDDSVFGSGFTSAWQANGWKFDEVKFTEEDGYFVEAGHECAKSHWSEDIVINDNL